MNYHVTLLSYVPRTRYARTYALAHSVRTRHTYASSRCVLFQSVEDALQDLLGFIMPVCSAL